MNLKEKSRLSDGSITGFFHWEMAVIRGDAACVPYHHRDRKSETMSESFQKEIPKARVNISLDLHTGGAQKRVELPLKLLVMGDYSAGRENAPLAERKKIDVNKHNFDAVLAELNPQATIDVENTLAGDGSDATVALNFKSMKDFEPEQVARQIPQLQALLATRNLLRDLKSNLLDNSTFRRELEKIVKNPALTESLRADLERIGTISLPPAGHA
jgi:type VI secretion system protein ImpB